MAMQISILGANFRTADVSRRERLALDADQTRRLLAAILQRDIFSEAVVLSTCNRTEVCYAAPDADGEGHFVEQWAALKGEAAPEDLPAGRQGSIFYRHRGPAAVTHLFRVAAALDSQVVGEHEILGQLKDAYRLAVEAGTAGFLLHKLMHRAFRVGKRVQTETALGQGNASIPQVAARLAESIHGDLSGLTVMLVGAGKAAELAAAALLRSGATRLIVANRTLARAAKLAEQLAAGQKDCSLHKHASDGPVVQARAIGIQDIPAHIGQADLVVSSTAAGEAVLTAESVGEVLRQKRTGRGQPGPGQKILLIDLAVPRDIDPRLAELPGVRLVNIDDLKDRATENVARRRLAVPAAEAIVQEEAAGFSRWLETLRAVPAPQRRGKRVVSVPRATDAEVQRAFP
jgi:glutamyl-tRNA reductase